MRSFRFSRIPDLDFDETMSEINSNNLTTHFYSPAYMQNTTQICLA